MADSWNRADILTRLRHRIWVYLSSAAVLRSDLAPTVEDLWNLEGGELHRLTAVHLAARQQTADVIAAAERVLHELPSSVVGSEQVLNGFVRGPVSWERTQRRRWQSGQTTLFVCRPAERRFDTPLARLVKLSLHLVVQLATDASLDHSGALGAAVHDRAERARELLRHRKLSEVPLVSSFAERTLAALLRRPSAAPLVTFVRDHREALELRDPLAVSDVIAGQLLAPASNDTLFELVTGFGLVDAICSLGFEVRRLSAIVGSRRPFARMVNGADEITMWWQRSVWSLALSRSRGGFYAQVLRDAQMSQFPLRPDFVVQLPRGNIVVVEVKHTMHEDLTPERAGIVDALAYLKDIEGHVEADFVRALVVAWNATGRPNRSAVIVSDQGHLTEAAELLVHG
jgi:hypothetical protein